MSLKSKFYGNVIIPLSYFIKGDIRFKYFKEYKKNLDKTKLEIQAFQLARLKEIIHHAYATVPYYRKLFDKLNIKPDDIKTIHDLKKIPVLDKKTVLSHLEELKSTKKYKLIKTFSGGSTGNKVVIFKDKKYYQLSAGVMLRDLYSLGIEPGHKSAWIWGDTNKDKSLKDKLFNFISFEVNRRILFNVFNYTDEKFIFWMKNSFNKFKPDYIYGYAGVIYDLAKCIKRNNLKIPRIKMIITTSERLEHRKFIESVFKCQVIDQYGCSEVISIAIEDKKQIMHSSDDFVIVEVTKSGEVLLTPLESYGMPLIRYKPGDIGLIKKKQNGGKSSPFNKFNIIIGRTYELMLNKNNEKVSGGLIKQIVEDENLDINEFQVVQKSLDEIEINIVKDEDIKEESVERLKAIVTAILGTTKFNVNYLKSFPIESNGKRIAFKCEIGK